VAKARLRPRVYELLSEAVEIGIAQGWRRARKHTSRPSPQLVQQEIYRAVMEQAGERFDFEERR
jgi:hypothetical protein